MSIEAIQEGICPKCHSPLVRFSNTHKCYSCRNYSVTVDAETAKESGLYRELWYLENKAISAGGNYRTNSDGTISFYIPSEIKGYASRALYKSGIKRV